MPLRADRPIEKEQSHKDGVCVPVLIAIAVPKRGPYQWTTYFRDLRKRNALECVDSETSASSPEFEERTGTGRELLGRLHKCLNAGYDASLGNDLRHPLQDDGLTTSR